MNSHWGEKQGCLRTFTEKTNTRGTVAAATHFLQHLVISFFIEKARFILTHHQTELADRRRTVTRLNKIVKNKYYSLNYDYFNAARQTGSNLTV